MKDRRELLKFLGVVGATGAVWKQPVVDSVSLPAHASTSGDIVTSMFFSGACANISDNQYYRMSFENEPAQAGDLVTIESFGSTDPGLPGGDQVVFFASHSDSDLTTMWRNSNGTVTSFISPTLCNEPTDASSCGDTPLVSGATFEICWEYSTGGPENPTMEFTNPSITA